MKRVHRRDLLKSVAAAAMLIPFSQRARAQSGQPPVLLCVEAKGAWDTTWFCDPVADPTYGFFAPEHVLQAGAISYAPYTVVNDVVTPYLVGGQDFFQKHAARMVVIRGVDNHTVSHIVGPRIAFAGTSRPGTPTLDALVAGAVDPDAALSLISAGGEVATEGIVPLTLGSDFDIIRRVLRPNATQPTDPQSTQVFLELPVHDLLRARQRERDQRLTQRLLAPRDLAATDRLARQRTAELVARVDALATGFDDLATGNSGNPLVVAGAGVLAAMSAGECVAAHLMTNGFDSHAGQDSFNNRTGHRPALSRIVEGIDFLVEGVLADPALAARGAIIVVASDFGRTVLNAEDGKDHWPITSMMVLAVGAAESSIRGGTVVGATAPFAADGTPINGARQLPVRVEGDTVVPTDDDDPTGILLTSAHVHVALRDLYASLGADPDGVFGRFPIPGADLLPLPLLRAL